MLCHILLFTSTYLSLLQPSSGCHTTIHTIYKQLHKLYT